MKAVVLIGNQQLTIQDVPFTSLSDDACRVRITNVGVCSSDVYRGFARGAYFYPLIMGHEIAGKVVDIGSAIKKFKIGDRVVIFPLLPCFNCKSCDIESYQQCLNYSYYGSRRHGGYAEYLDVVEWNLLPIPDRVSLADAATMEPLSVIVHAIKRAKIFEEERPLSVAILGAGFLGLLMAQIIQKKVPHCELHIFDRNSFKLEIAKRHVNQIFLVRDNTEWQQLLLKQRNTYQIVIEASGVPSAFINSIELVAYNGKILWLGNITDDLILPQKLVGSILRKELTLLGTWNSEYGSKPSDDWKDALSLLEEGMMPSQLVTHWISLDDIPETLKKLYDHKMRAGRFDCIKVMIQNKD